MTAMNNVRQFVLAGAMFFLIVGSSAAQWTLLDSVPTKRNLNSIIWTGRLAVIVGDSGTILTSTDAKTWSSRGLTTVPLYSVTKSDSLLLAVGDSGKILTSPDSGVTWTSRNSGVTALLRGVAWTGKKYVAVGNAGTILSSSDGTTWSPCTSGTTRRLNSVAWTGAQFVTVGDSGKILTSPDGVVWSLRNSGISQELYSVTWTGSQIVTVGGGRALMSTNGSLWKDCSMIRAPWLSTIELYSVFGTEAQIVASGTINSTTSGLSCEMFSSTDLPIWYEKSGERYGTSFIIIRSIALTDKQYLAVGEKGSILASPKGILETRGCQ
jgi:photosystem II stability/assembly factor-like uncharacterized protein